MNSASKITSIAASIKKNGALIELRKPSLESYDPVTGKTIVSAPSSFPIYGVLLNYTSQEIDGTNILSGDRKVLVGADISGAAPTVEDVFVINHSTWSIKSVRPLEPAGVPLMYTIQVRQ